MIHHVLVPTDGSENAERAVRFSAQVADRRQQADIIVVGTRGLSPLRSAIMGSVSHSLIEKATCPVLVVK